MLLPEYEKQNELDPNDAWEKLHSLIHSCEVTPIYWKGEQTNLSPPPLSKEQMVSVFGGHVLL